MACLFGLYLDHLFGIFDPSQSKLEASFLRRGLGVSSVGKLWLYVARIEPPNWSEVPLV